MKYKYLPFLAASDIASLCTLAQGVSLSPVEIAIIPWLREVPRLPSGGEHTITTDLLVLLVFGREVLNVHNWRFVLLVPVALTFVAGAAFGVAGLLRLAKEQRKPT